MLRAGESSTVARVNEPRPDLPGVARAGNPHRPWSMAPREPAGRPENEVDAPQALRARATFLKCPNYRGPSGGHPEGA